MFKLISALVLASFFLGCAPTILDSYEPEPEQPAPGGVVVVDQGTGGQGGGTSEPPPSACSDNVTLTGCGAPVDVCHVVVCEDYMCKQSPLSPCDAGA